MPRARLRLAMAMADLRLLIRRLRFSTFRGGRMPPGARQALEALFRRATRAPPRRRRHDSANDARLESMRYFRVTGDHEHHNTRISSI